MQDTQSKVSSLKLKVGVVLVAMVTTAESQFMS